METSRSSTKHSSDDYAELAEANQRRPQNEVARFILADLDKATEMLKETAPEANRLTKYAALLLKSRVALYEGTWLKYHAGTDRVPGWTRMAGCQRQLPERF